MKNKRVLFVGSLCSDQTINEILACSKRKMAQAAPKFYKLLFNGLAECDDVMQIETISTLPISELTHDKRFWLLPQETEGKIEYNYVPIINLGLLKNLVAFIICFFKVLFWGLGKRKGKVIICDVLAFSSAAATWLATRINRIKVVAIITDIPGMITLDKRKDFPIKSRIASRLSEWIFKMYDGYVFLTEQMNDLINVRSKPYIVIEGLADMQMASMDNCLENKPSEKILLYAGGINEIYGIKKTIDAFMNIKGDDLRFHIYGHGPMEKDMPRYMEMDSRIVYFGVVPNAEIVKRELEATLLINPRSSKEEFTKYSFPSKNMEYMASGTPLLTTPLLGMPKEYNEYVYLFDDESTDGMQQTLSELFGKPREELHELGARAKQFVLAKKNHLTQAHRLDDFIEMNVISR